MTRSKKVLTPVLPLTKSPRPESSVRSLSLMRTAYMPKLRVVVDFPEGSGRTKQSFKAECDINNIMARFQRTGVLDFTNRHAPQYFDCTGIEFQRAVELVGLGKEMFGDLPSALRARFGNDPAEFFDFVQDPANEQELIRLGLKEKPKAEGEPLVAPAEPGKPVEASGKPQEGGGTS